mmetsp:Transcript_63241/g.184799  ORF Transcript_63241/g.184799 Transcript_63241/m.184799 type:complete len:253 (+) Transcript_63241:458-1216(+)
MDLSHNALFQGLSEFDKSSERRVPPFRPRGLAPKQAARTLDHQHDHRRVQAWPVARATLRTPPLPARPVGCSLAAARSAEAARAVPERQTASCGQQGRIVIGYELVADRRPCTVAQGQPACPGADGRLRKVRRLGQVRQVQQPEPCFCGALPITTIARTLRQRSSCQAGERSLCGCPKPCLETSARCEERRDLSFCEQHRLEATRVVRAYQAKARVNRHVQSDACSLCLAALQSTTCVKERWRAKAGRKAGF